MATGLLYEVPCAAAVRLAACESLADWYAALDDLDVDRCPTFDAEDALVSLAEATRSGPPALARLWSGDQASPAVDSNDPCVTFIGNAGANEAADALRAFDPDAFRRLLDGNAADAWIREPLLEFLSTAARNGNAVVLIWGG